MKNTVPIAFVTESLGPGGAERQLVQLIRHLDRARFPARVLTYAPGDFFQAELEAECVPVQYQERRGRWDPAPALRLARWLRSHTVDLVVGYLYSGNLYAVLARALAGRGAVVATERSQLAREAGLGQLHAPWAMRRADRVIANSERARDELVGRWKLAPGRVVAVPNSIDLARFSPAEDRRANLRRQLGWPENRRIVLTVASFKAPKNYAGLVEAMKWLDATGLGLFFCWVGARPEPKEYERVRRGVASLGLQDAVAFLEPQPNVEDLYRAADLLLLNSLWEGTPNVVLEALACGCPVLATAVSDIPCYVRPGETGWLIAPGDLAGLKSALASAAHCEARELREMGAAGRRHLQGLGLDPRQIARRHEAIFDELVARPGA